MVPGRIWGWWAEPHRQDRALACAALAAAEAEVLVRGADDPVTLVSVALATLSLGLRRRAPLAMTAGFLAGLIGRTVILGGADSDMVSFTSLLVVYSLAAHGPHRRALALALALALGYALDLLLAGQLPAASVVGLPLLFLGPWIAGRMLRSHRRLTAELWRRNRELEAQREDRAEMAALVERNRIAGQLHEVVSAVVRAMVADAERGAAAEDDASRSEAFLDIEHEGRRALAQMRSLLGVLRSDDQALSLSPQPSLSELQHLVDRARARGLPVALSVRGRARALPSGVDASAYRIVQEALDASLGAPSQHGSSVGLEVSYGEDALRLQVSGLQDGSARERERTWVAIRERVSLYRGSFALERRDDGAMTLDARLPLEAPGA